MKSKWDKILSDMKERAEATGVDDERFDDLLLMFKHLEPAIEQDEMLADLSA